MTSQIAAHYDRAGATEQAVAWYRRAAAAAQQLHASGTAVRQLNRALGLLRSMPPSAKRDAVELDVHTALLVPLISMTGSAGVGRTSRRHAAFSRATSAASGFSKRSAAETKVVAASARTLIVVARSVAEIPVESTALASTVTE